MLQEDVLALLLLVAPAHAQSAEELLARMKGAWDQLQSYKTGQIIQERVRGELGAEQRVRVAFRKPWEIQLEWETVHPGRKVYWSEQRHGGEVQVYPGGLTGRTLGVLSFSLDNGILKRDTNYTPAAGGFGYLIQTVWKQANSARRATAGTPAAVTIRGEPAWSVALSDIGHERYDRAELVVSKATGLPLKFTSWRTDGELAERYEWFDTVVNAPLVDTVDFSVGYR